MKKLWLTLTTNLLENFILLYVFLLPWSTVFIFSEKFINGIKWEPATGVIYATELLLWLIFIIFLFKNLKTTKINWQEINFKNQKLIIVLLLWLFVGFSGLSIFWSPEKISVFYLWIKLIQAGILFFIIPQSKLQTLNICWALLLSASLQSLLSIWQFLSQQTIGNKFLGLIKTSAEIPGSLVIETESSRWLRSYGSFNDPNFLAGFLSLSLVSAFHLYLNSRYKKTISVLITLNTFGLFFTFSRGAFIALFIGLVIVAFNNKKRYLELLPTLFNLIISLFILSIVFQPLLINRLNNAERLTQKSNQERLTQNQIALTVFRKQPILGTSFNNYSYNLYINNPNLPTYEYKRVENIYLLILSELGVVGLLILLLLISTILIKTIKKKNFEGLALIAVLLVLGIFYHYPVSQYQGLTLFFLILSLGLINNKNIL